VSVMDMTSVTESAVLRKSDHEYQGLVSYSDFFLVIHGEFRFQDMSISLMRLLNNFISSF
jgi:hypothetical protein